MGGFTKHQIRVIRFLSDICTSEIYFPLILLFLVWAFLVVTEKKKRLYRLRILSEIAPVESSPESFESNFIHKIKILHVFKIENFILEVVADDLLLSTAESYQECEFRRLHNVSVVPVHSSELLWGIFRIYFKLKFLQNNLHMFYFLAFNRINLEF